MRSKTSERSDDTSPLSNGRLCAGSCEKILRTFAHSVALCNKIVLSSLVCVLVCLSIEVWPSNATNAEPISTLPASVEAPYLHLYPPLLAFKAVLRTRSLVGICALFTRETFKPELELQAGTCSYQALYMYKYIWYVEVPGWPVAYVCMNTLMRTYPLWRMYGVPVVFVVDVVVRIYLEHVFEQVLHLIVVYTLHTNWYQVYSGSQVVAPLSVRDICYARSVSYTHLTLPTICSV